MFSLFPSDWSAPKKPKWMEEKGIAEIKLTGKMYTPPPPPIPSAPVSYAQNATPEPPAITSVPVRNVPPAPIFPKEEMLRPSEEVDLTEVNDMLASLGMLAEADSKGEIVVSEDDVKKMIVDINKTLAEHIKKLREANSWEEPMSREEMLDLLEAFVKYSKTLEEYFLKRKD